MLFARIARLQKCATKLPQRRSMWEVATVAALLVRGENEKLSRETRFPKCGLSKPATAAFSEVFEVFAAQASNALVPEEGQAQFVLEDPTQNMHDVFGDVQHRERDNLRIVALDVHDALLSAESITDGDGGPESNSDEEFARLVRLTLRDLVGPALPTIVRQAIPALEAASASDDDLHALALFSCGVQQVVECCVVEDIAALRQFYT